MYKAFIQEFNKLERGVKQEKIQSFLSIVQHYYSSVCQGEELEKVKKHIEQLYDSKRSDLSISDYLIEELYFNFYTENVSEYNPSTAYILSIFMDYEDTIETEFTEFIENDSLLNLFENTCKKFKKNPQINFVNNISKLHAYMDLYKQNKTLVYKDVEEALRETISNEGIEHLMQVFSCTEGLEDLYLQPIRGLFVLYENCCTRNTSRTKYTKSRTSTPLLKKNIQIETIQSYVEPYYREYLETMGWICKVPERAILKSVKI